MKVNSWITQSCHLEEANIIREAPYVVHGNYIYDIRAYIWYVGNRKNMILLQENYIDQENVTNIENIEEFRNINVNIYTMIDELFYKSLYFQHFYSNKIYIKYNDQKYYFEIKDKEYNHNCKKDSAFTIDFNKFESEIRKLQYTVFAKKIVDQIFCF